MSFNSLGLGLCAVQEEAVQILTMFLSHLRSSNDEAATGLQVIYGFIIKEPTGNHRFHHMLLQTMAHLVQTYALIVLHRDHNGVDTQRHHGASILPVLNGNLRGPKKIKNKKKHE